MGMRPVRSRRAVGLTVAVVLSVVAGRAAGYGLEFTPRDDTVRQVAPNDVAEFHLTLTNTGTTSDVFEFDCRVVSVVPGWAAVYCVNGVCVEPGVLRYDTIPADGSDTTPKVTVYTDTAQGEEVVSLRVRSLGDTTLAESVGVHTIVGSGVEELSGFGPPGVAFVISPDPVRRNRTTTLSFSSEEPRSFSLELFDAAGCRVSLIAAGTAPSGRHVISWHPERPPARGVYLVRLTAGDESAVRKLVVE